VGKNAALPDVAVYIEYLEAGAAEMHIPPSYLIRLRSFGV
jgi:hypothetical protein